MPARLAMRVLAPLATCVAVGAVHAQTENPQVRLGRSVFYSQQVGAGPLFNAASCNECHHDGAGGRGPASDGVAPASLEIQLAVADGQRRGDPVYGHVFNTAALPGMRPEGTVTVRYTEIYGYYYPDGLRWRMRRPHYQLDGLSHGPLAGSTVIKPRLAPPLFGVGLLEAVPDSRFGWQGEALSVRDQTTRALAGEMGLTSPDRPADDCTASETDCLQIEANAAPKMTDEVIAALVAFERALPVPSATGDDPLGAELFVEIGCAGCHRQQLPVELTQPDGSTRHDSISPYTDLRLHDLGPEMSDTTAAGEKVASKWRTAPLWGLGFRLGAKAHPTLLHDGRARSAEEAILWHSGEAAPARRNFVSLGPRSRAALLHWVETR
jgi:CxxC motif-containing protein (DUF1111 family)